MTTIPEHKADLRRLMRARRRARSSSEQGRLAEGLLGQARRRPELAGATVVTGYVALPGEPDLGLVLAWLAENGARVLLPVVTVADDGSPALAWADADDGLAPGASTPTGARILEPQGLRLRDPGRVDVVFLPGLAVDHRGRRLGQGAGYYDRTVQRLGWYGPDGPRIVAVVHDDEVVEQVPAEAFDTRAHAILTPTRWVSISEG